MKTYYANYNANNGTRFSEDITGTNKAKLIAEIREIAEGSRYEGSECTWMVKDDKGCIVAMGGCDCKGRRYRREDLVGQMDC